jgi:glycosyltransferase involved in cell wall biosynthesis
VKRERTLGGKTIVRLGYLGPLTKRSGVDLLIDSLRRLPRGRWELRIGGRGTRRAEARLRRLCARLPVRFVRTARHEEFLPDIDLLVVPSRWAEPFARSVAQAFRYGVPVLAAARGSIPELVEDEVTGLLFDPDSPGAVERAIRRIFLFPSRLAEMRPTCLLRAERFATGNVVREYREVYDGALRRAASVAPSVAPSAEAAPMAVVTEAEPAPIVSEAEPTIALVEEAAPVQPPVPSPPPAVRRFAPRWNLGLSRS